MRAKLPDQTGFVERDGVRLHYEVYGSGPQTMLFIPPWSIVHSRVYKAQLPYFSGRFRCIAYDGRGNGKSDRPDRAEAYSLENSVADALAVMDCDRHGRGHPGRPVLRRPDRLRARGPSSRAGEGRHPGRHRGADRARPFLHDAAAFPGAAASSSRAGTSTIARTGWPTIPTSPSTSSATSSPSRTRPSRSRTASAGPARPTGRCW